jgi:hypothetical protein
LDYFNKIAVTNIILANFNDIFQKTGQTPLTKLLQQQEHLQNVQVLAPKTLPNP